VSSIVSDINRAEAQNGEKKDRIEQLILSNLDVPGIDQLYAQRKAGLVDDVTVVKKIAERKSQVSELNLRKAMREDAKGNLELDAKFGEEEFNKMASIAISNVFDDIQTAAGLSSADKLTDLLRKHVNGEITIPTDQIRSIGEQLRSQRTAVRNALWRKANAPAEVPGSDGNTKSIVQRVGAEKVNSALDTQMQIYDSIV